MMLRPRIPSSAALRRLGILGMNKRNAHYIALHNRRSSFPKVDNKLLTKALAEEAGIATPELYCKVEVDYQTRQMHKSLDDKPGFVVKPAHGSGGNGILVITGRLAGKYQKANGATLDKAAVSHHVSQVLSGMFSLGGQPDQAMVEALVQFDDTFSHISYQGVPDIRVIVFRGVPAAAMVRLPTRESDGKANLHQGAVGMGVDIGSGQTLSGVYNNRLIETHPDTGNDLAGNPIPDWTELLDLAARCADFVDLGYLGVDIVLDANRGPLVLELNARPGLNVQLANGAGLTHRLAKIEAMQTVPEDSTERVALAQTLF